MMVALLVALVTMVGALPASDFVDDLDQASTAEFTGRQLVVCWSADGVVAQIAEVEQSDGMTMVKGPDGSFAIGDGKMIGQYAEGIRYLDMEPSGEWRLWDGYTVRSGTNTTGVPDARVVEVVEAGRLRARFVLDAGSAAPLTTEVFDGDGSLYRYSSLIEFQPRDGSVMMDMSDMPEPERREPARAATLPAAAGRFQAADAYAAPGGVQVFYSDGLFRFSVFEVSRKSDGGGLGDTPAVDIGGVGGYHEIFTPAAVSVFWRTADRAYVLIGDLPPDQLVQVLADLPAPGRANVLKRAWRWLFG